MIKYKNVFISGIIVFSANINIFTKKGDVVVVKIRLKLKFISFINRRKNTYNIYQKELGKIVFNQLVFLLFSELRIFPKRFFIESDRIDIFIVFFFSKICPKYSGVIIILSNITEIYY